MLPQNEIRSMLAGGDRRSIGRVAEIVELSRGRPQMVSILVECLFDEDTCVRMRAADALEKISRDQPILLQPHKIVLFNLLAEASQQEVRWHLAVIVPRLQLTASESHKTARVLQTYLKDRSSIVKTCAMQGLADLAERHSSLGQKVIDLLRPLTRAGTPAMRARGRRLLAKLERENL